MAADARPGVAAGQVMRREGAALFVSVASLWELAIKLSLGKLQLDQPFDRLLVAQAQHEQMPLITGDSRLAAYDVTCVW